MKEDLYNKLQQIASGRQYTESTNIENVSEIRSKDLKKKLNNITDSIKKMYPTKPKKVFETWKQATKDFPLPTKSFKEDYWKEYLNLSPDGPDKEKQKLITNTELELQMLESPTEKEHYLRDKVSKWPEWLVNEFKDDIQNLSARNSITNLNKSKQVYKDDLSKRLGSISNKELDADVSEESHIDDLLKLEKMNLMDVADSFNGRFGVVDKAGAFVPAFDLQDRAQVFENDPYGTPSLGEQTMVDELAPDFIRNFVKGNLSNQRAKINLDNKASEGVAKMMLETGSLTPDKWGEAFSMFSKPEYQTLIEQGLKGEINSGRVKNDEDLVKTIYMAMNQYKDLLGESTDATNP